MEIDSLYLDYWELRPIASFIFNSSLFFYFSNSDNVKLNHNGFNALKRSCPKAYPRKKQKHIKKKINEKQIRSYKKCPLYKKKHTFLKTFSSSVNFALVLQTKFFKKLLQNFCKKNLLFFSCFTLVVNFYKIGKQPS